MQLFCQRDFDTGIFLLILQIFYKYLFYRTPTVHASFTLTKFEGM